MYVKVVSLSPGTETSCERGTSLEQVHLREDQGQSMDADSQSNQEGPPAPLLTSCPPSLFFIVHFTALWFAYRTEGREAPDV